jgi:hypothetical protein
MTAKTVDVNRSMFDSSWTRRMATRGGRSDWRFVVGPAICGGLREIARQFTGGVGICTHRRLYAAVAVCGLASRRLLMMANWAGWRRVLAAVVGGGGVGRGALGDGAAGAGGVV